jgi:outer membrane protein OmpA-like peptidoglycan-associated protein
MKHTKLTLLTSVALMGLGVGTLYAGDYGFTSHYTVSEVEAVRNLSPEDKLVARNYLNYEQREKCQNYRPVPNGLDPDRCLKKEKVVNDMGINNVIMSYEINFAFDSSAMDATGQRTINQIVNDIQKYNPSEIVVAGYTDSSGTDDYNVLLSQRRSDIVSNILTNRGVMNRRIDQEAHGENHQAVNTNNGVMLRENRRTVIEFRK